MSTERNLHSLSRTLEDKDIYKAVLDTRNFEISLFWQRSNYFLALNSALAVGFFTREPSQVTLLLASLGVLASLLWYFVMLGSKYWQSRWEDKLAEVEALIAPDLKAFAATRETTDAAVLRSLANNPHRWLAGQVLSKPSVSFQMTILSLVFVAGWCVVAVLAISQGAWSKSAFAASSSAATYVTAVPARLTCSSSTDATPLVPAPSITANPTINVQVTTPEQQPLSPRTPPTVKKRESQCK